MVWEREVEFRFPDSFAVRSGHVTLFWSMRCGQKSAGGTQPPCNHKVTEMSLELRALGQTDENVWVPDEPLQHPILRTL